MQFDPAFRRVLLFGLLGLVIAGALITAVQFRPASILPANGILQIQLSATPVDVAGTGRGCTGDCNFTRLMVTVDSVTVHRSGPLNLTGEWITVVNTTETIDVVKLTSTAQIFGSASVPEGTITQIRMHVTKATGTLKNGQSVSLTVPSDELKLNVDSTIRSGTTTSINIQVAPHVVHTGNGEWKLTPVLQLKSS